MPSVPITALVSTIGCHLRKHYAVPYDNVYIRVHSSTLCSWINMQKTSNKSISQHLKCLKCVNLQQYYYNDFVNRHFAERNNFFFQNNSIKQSIFRLRPGRKSKPQYIRLFLIYFDYNALSALTRVSRNESCRLCLSDLCKHDVIRKTGST